MLKQNRLTGKLVLCYSTVHRIAATMARASACAIFCFRNAQKRIESEFAEWEMQCAA